MQARTTIRWAVPEDAPAIATIHLASWRAAYQQIIPASFLDGLSVEKFASRHRKAIASGTEQTAVVELDGRIVGWCTLGECRDEDKAKPATGEIWGIYLAPEFWRKGIGTECVRWAESELLLRRKSEVVLWVLEANSPSRRFYEAKGYKEDGAKKEITISVPLTAVRYAKILVVP
ncbi:MAG: GNAT family N-acetyltransferase [Phycisphaerae bacterium]|jgi:RimJ/RimL family protein N-acetyltransferase